MLDSHETILSALNGMNNPAALWARAQTIFLEEKQKQLKQQQQQQQQQQISPKQSLLAAAAVKRTAKDIEEVRCSLIEC